MKGNMFIKRPVMAISISVLILAIGLISLFTLPVEQYPDIAPPTVYVSASYTGADAEVCDEQRHHAAGREHQRGGRHDVYHVQRLQCRSGYHTGLLQARHRPRHGGCQRTEPCSQSTGTAARRSNESRRKHDETTDQLPANRRDGLHRRSLRPDLPCQLSGHQRHPADQTYRGSRRRHGAWAIPTVCVSG